MKKIYTYILLMACAMMFAGCQKEWDGIIPVEMEGFQGNNGKVYLNDANYACWEHGDEIWGFSPNIEYPYMNTINISGNKAIIKSDSWNPIGTTDSFPTSGKIASTYPLRMKIYNNGSLEDFIGMWNMQRGHDEFTYTFPNNQVYQTTTVNGVTKQKLEAPMVASTTLGAGCELKYYNLAALINVHITNNTGSELPLSKIMISGKKITGSITVTPNYNEDSAPTIASDVNQQSNNEVTLYTPNCVIPNGETTDFYIYVPAGQARQYGVKLVYNEMELFNKISQAITIERSHMVRIPITLGGGIPIPQGTGESNDPYRITTADQLVELMQGEGGLSKHYKLMNTINLTEMTVMNWADFAGFGNERIPFTGTFDGNKAEGYKIINGTVDAKSHSGVFNQVGGNAQIHHLVVETQMVVDNTSRGGIVNSIGDAQIAYCEVTSNSRIEGSDSYNCGGIVGEVIEDYTTHVLTILDCTNGATISVPQTSSRENIGGIIGDGKESTIEIRRCKNLGDISGSTSVGGIIGHIVGAGNSIVDCCINSGTISGGNVVGGIAAFCDNGNVEITNCANHGNVTGSENIGGIVGGYYARIKNCYSDATINGSGSGSIGGIIGQIVGYEINNVYVAGTVNNGKWIVGHDATLSNTYNSIYSPSDRNNIGGSDETTLNGQVTPYNNSNWTVNGEPLVDVLNRNNMGYERWVAGEGGKPKLAFE